jgi:hypothetical protein
VHICGCKNTIPTANPFSISYILSMAVGLEMQDVWFKIRREKAFRDSQAGAW